LKGKSPTLRKQKIEERISSEYIGEKEDPNSRPDEFVEERDEVNGI